MITTKLTKFSTQKDPNEALLPNLTKRMEEFAVNMARDQLKRQNQPLRGLIYDIVIVKAKAIW